MSQVQVPFVKYIDPRLNLQKDQQFSSAQSASLITTTLYTPNGEVGTAVGFSCNPPNRNHIVSRNVIKEAVIEFDIKKATDVNVKVLDNFTHGPIYMPLSRITNNEDITVGNATVSQANANILRETVCRFDDDTEYSSSSNMNDTYRKFEDVENSNRSALAPYEDTTGAGTQFGEITSRAGFYGYEAKFSGDANYVPANELKSPATGGNIERTYNVRIIVEEPLFLSPFVFGKDSENATGLVGIDSIHYNCSFGDISQVWTNTDGNVAVVNGSFNISKFGLRFKYLTPQPNQSIPRNMLYPYYEPQVRTGPVITLNAGENTGEESLTYQLTGIPRRMYICMRDTDRTGQKPLRHLQLQNLSLYLSINGQNTLRQQTNKQLYDMSVRNGLCCSYSQFQLYTGSVVCVDFGNGDAALMPEQVAGLNQKNTFEIRAVYNNQLGEAVNAQFCVVWIYDGIFRMDDGATSKSINPLRDNNVLETKAVQNLHKDDTPDNVYGGSLWGGLRSIGKDVLQCALEKRALSKVMGEGGRSLEDMARGVMGSGLEPMDTMGGRMMSRNMLRNRY